MYIVYKIQITVNEIFAQFLVQYFQIIQKKRTLKKCLLLFGFCVIIKKINKGDKHMKKVYIIATSVGSTVSIKTTTDKEVVFRTIKEYSGDL